MKSFLHLDIHTLDAICHGPGILSKSSYDKIQNHPNISWSYKYAAGRKFAKSCSEEDRHALASPDTPSYIRNCGAYHAKSKSALHAFIKVAISEKDHDLLDHVHASDFSDSEISKKVGQAREKIGPRE